MCKADFCHTESEKTLDLCVCECVCVCTCVLRDLSLGDHLFAFGIHRFTVLVLFQTLKDVLSLRFCAEPLKHTFT